VNKSSDLPVSSCGRNATSRLYNFTEQSWGTKARQSVEAVKRIPAPEWAHIIASASRFLSAGPANLEMDASESADHTEHTDFYSQIEFEW